MKPTSRAIETKCATCEGTGSIKKWFIIPYTSSCKSCSGTGKGPTISLVLYESNNSGPPEAA